VLQLEVADVLLEDGDRRIRDKIIKALTLARANLEEARRSVMDLRAGPLQKRSLPAALEELVGEFGSEFDVRAEFRARDVITRLPAAVEAGLYRIAQEALTNVGKYADPRTLRVILEARDGELRLSVEDDGVGFDPVAPRDRRKGGFGLIGMQERSKLLGGSFDIDSAPGRGTRIEVVVPLGARRQPAAVAGGGASS
ncbi:MAG: sensor histidine kinase, partial [Chloroflexi bacterium]|nr:sensor histidine kinase [Chloroflexota bacterium]